MEEFKKYHPMVICFSCFIIHPVTLAVSFFTAFAYSVMLKGKKAIRKNLLYMTPLILFTALINPAFNHDGATILSYLPDGNPLTLESIIYGVCAAVMIAAVICHFSCYNEVMTSDKFIYLFGRIIPALSLIISMVLRFVPRFSAQLKVVINARKCMGQDISKGSIIKRAKNGLTVLSIMTTWALENAIETADSMKSRGYGAPGRTAFSVFSFDKRDLKALCALVLLGGYVLFGGIYGGFYFRFFPSIKTTQISFFEISLFAAYLLLFTLPIIIELWEVRKWRSLRSKI